MAARFTIPGNRLAQQSDSIKDEVDEAVDRVKRRAVFKPDLEVAAFEAEFARYVGVKHALAVASGSFALLLALKALDIKPGDEVISVANVDISVSAPIVHAGARPVWVDIHPRTYNLDPQQLEAKITPRTRAILVVHMYGNPVELNSITEIANQHRIPVIEDASLAHGAIYRDQRVGSMGKIGCFSFSPGKILGAYGQAGMIVTHDAELAQRISILANYGYQPSAIVAIREGAVGARFDSLMNGYNACMDELQAAVLRVKLRRLDDWLQHRRKNAHLYREILSDLEPRYLLLPQDTPQSEPVYRVYVIRSPHRDALMHQLAQAGIWTGLQYVPPLHLQPVYQHPDYGPGSLPQTELVTTELLCLPTIPELSAEEIVKVGHAIRQFFLT
ncbi:MAG: DegT/DnrJ/EryC1/StrS family aminotransferase [Anaerolineae bacterium]|nr:DegT/DnrJ/EryC1/StrS family aminotransferase [Anaerolineae bacterium]